MQLDMGGSKSASKHFQGHLMSHTEFSRRAFVQIASYGAVSLGALGGCATPAKSEATALALADLERRAGNLGSAFMYPLPGRVCPIAVGSVLPWRRALSWPWRR
jgi:hypothetical protein